MSITEHHSGPAVSNLGFNAMTTGQYLERGLFRFKVSGQVLVRNRRQVLLVILREFKRINQLLFLLKSAKISGGIEFH